MIILLFFPLGQRRAILVPILAQSSLQGQDSNRTGRERPIHKLGWTNFIETILFERRRELETTDSEETTQQLTFEENGIGRWLMVSYNGRTESHILCSCVHGWKNGTESRRRGSPMLQLSMILVQRTQFDDALHSIRRNNSCNLMLRGEKRKSTMIASEFSACMILIKPTDSDSIITTRRY